MIAKKLSVPLIAFGVIVLSFTACAVTEALFYSHDDPGIARPPDDSIVIDQTFLPNDPPYPVIAAADGEFRAVWVATVLNLDFPTKPGMTAAALTREIDAIVTNTARMGLNAIILQVRPTGDALYESEIFPWSAWLTGEQGVGIDGFDPLAYWLEACRANDIELHAWLNPYRIIHTSMNSSDPETLAESNPVRQRPELAVAWTSPGGRDGLFLDPGLPEARALIVDGIVELITNYDVDGVHIDDYFYPGRDFDDAATFNLYGQGLELDDWRRENVNEMIRGIQAAIREHNMTNGKNVRWGISPTAIWKNGSSDPLGIPTTAGQESYHALYADTRRWVTEQWVDYICPQIYWYIGFEIADFEAIFNWWDALCAPYNVDLYVGHAAYREFEDNQPPHWQGEMLRQLEMLEGSDYVAGSVFYRYFSLRSSVGRAITDYYAQRGDFPQREPIVLADTLAIGFPHKDETISGTAGSINGYNIIGTSLPDRPLYLNGEEVASRTAEGFFHVFAPLSPGDNVFTFSQEGAEDAVRVITFNTPGTATPDPNATPAPTPAATPSPTPAAQITNITAPDYATVTSNEAWIFSANSTDNRIEYMLEAGMRDRIVATSSNNMVKLSSGIWVRSDSISTRRESSVITDVLTDGVYRIGQYQDAVVWQSETFPVAVASYDGVRLTVSFGMHSTAPHLALPEDFEGTLFSGARSGIADGVPYWEFTLRGDARFEGYYFEHDGSEFRLCLNKRKSLSEGDKPLEGITVMLDPGHGGDSHGALGPFGFTMAEKEIVLINTKLLAERLEVLGATVLLTREADVEVSLQERVNMSREAKPDLFISLHINSIAETTNAQAVRGFSVWYQNAVAVNFANTALDVLHFINPETNRQKVLNNANFFVCRPWWSPHVLLESSFICNIYDYVWLIDPFQQERLADATADAILDYFAA